MSNWWWWLENKEQKTQGDIWPRSSTGCEANGSEPYAHIRATAFADVPFRNKSSCESPVLSRILRTHLSLRPMVALDSPTSFPRFLDEYRDRYNEYFTWETGKFQIRFRQLPLTWRCSLYHDAPLSHLNAWWLLASREAFAMFGKRMTIVRPSGTCWASQQSRCLSSGDRGRASVRKYKHRNFLF